MYPIVFLGHGNYILEELMKYPRRARDSIFVSLLLAWRLIYSNVAHSIIVAHVYSTEIGISNECAAYVMCRLCSNGECRIYTSAFRTVSDDGRVKYTAAGMGRDRGTGMKMGTETGRRRLHRVISINSNTCVV